MTRCRITAICGAATGVLLLAACGGSSNKTPTNTATRTTVSTATRSATKILTSAVVAAVDADHATSNAALLSNTVPAKPSATAGPALETLRRSAAGRRARGIRVRMLHDQLRVVSVQLDPSYTTATAMIRDLETVQPTHTNGKAFGHPVTQTERARVELHRVVGTDRFVVWKVVTGQ
jgi:hypothetical protein